ncbi:MAG: geranylgeranyl reductase family protein [Gloeomargarita sp. GMQP_bins_44]
MRYDVIVVGAGPGGGSAAYHLAKRGRSVLLLEQASLPRYKPCGGGVSPQVQEWFDFDFTPAISCLSCRIHYTWQLGDPVTVELTDLDPIWMVRRDVFDHFLVQQAQRQGAQVQDGTAVTGIAWQGDGWQVQTTGEPYRGRYLVAADGAKGKLAGWLGFRQRRRLAGALEAEVPLLENPRPRICFEFGLVHNGYAWNFPKRDGFSLGVGTLAGGGISQDLRRILQTYAAHFQVDVAQARQYGHPLCLWDAPQPLHTENALLVGEAACVVDPFTAEGIRPSLWTGWQAALALDQALAGDRDALARYTATVQNTWGRDMVWAKRLAQVFYRWPGLAYRVGVKRPGATRKFAELFTGKTHYEAVAHLAWQRLQQALPW